MQASFIARVALMAFAVQAMNVRREDGVELYSASAGSGGRTIVLPGAVNYPRIEEQLTTQGHLVTYDMRSRGRSPLITDEQHLQRGILNDVDDLEAVVAQRTPGRVTIVAHSYMALTALLYTIRHPEAVERLVLIDPLGPAPARHYPAEFSYTPAQMPSARQAGPGTDPCRAFWRAAYRLQVYHPELAATAYPDVCVYETEQPANVQRTLRFALTSAGQISVARAEMRRVRMPVLVIHGRQDAIIPHAAGMDWAANLPNARLLLVDEAGHAPWVDQPRIVLPAIRTFVAGRWPRRAVILRNLPFPSAATQ